MKQFLLLTILFLTLTSCGNQTSNDDLAITELNHDVTHRSSQILNIIETFKLDSTQLNLLDMQTITMSKSETSEADVMLIMNSLMGAAKEEQLTDIKLTISDEPVENGVFIFNIEAQSEKHLTLQMFDEEGYEMTAHNQLNINRGHNYKGLNVKSMEAGNYIFRIVDEKGSEMTRTIKIENK